MVMYTIGDIVTMLVIFTVLWLPLCNLIFSRCQEEKASVLCFLAGPQKTSCFTLTTNQTGGICINWMMTTKRPAYALSLRRLVNQHGLLEEVLIHVTQMAMGTCWLFMARYEWLLNNPSALSYLIVNKINLQAKSQVEDFLKTHLKPNTYFQWGGWGVG